MMLITGAARADQSSSDALALLDRGIVLYEKGDLDGARANFVAARDLVPERPNPHRWLGLTEARLHHCREAIAELERFLVSAPSDDPRRSEAAAVRDQCRGELAPQLGTMAVGSRPPGAEVRVDEPGAPPAGTTPCQLALVEGRHVLYLSKAGFVAASAEVQVVPRSSVRLELPLEAVPVVVAKPPRRSRAGLIAGVVVGVVVAGAAIGLGVGLGVRGEQVHPISPIMGAP